MHSGEGQKGSSLDYEQTVPGKRDDVQITLHIFDIGRFLRTASIPCLRWEWTRRTSGHSCWVCNQADRVLNGRVTEPESTSWIEMGRTTESSALEIKEQI